MAFQVELSAQASHDIGETFEWLKERNAVAADKWFNGVISATYTLNDSPRRCSIIPEQDNFTQEIRHLIYQKYRIIFTIQDETVYVLTVRHDLLVSGDDVAWLNVCKLLYLNTEKRDIVVEAKATNSPLPDKQFARLCSIMDLNLTGSGLGIFFTLNGAIGFPKSGSSRQRAVSDCRLRQIIFHAKTNKIIVVLDKSDIFELDKNGTLIQIITRKIRDLFELSGLPTTPATEFCEIDLPTHLKSLYDS